MFLTNVITYIKDHNRKTIYEDSKLLDMIGTKLFLIKLIENLTRVNERWLRIVDNHQG
jgi:hypothetical protein